MSAYEFVAFRARELGVDVNILRGPYRTPQLVRARAAIAGELRSDPWRLSLPAIGKALNRHHTSVWSLLRGGKGKVHG